MEYEDAVVAEVRALGMRPLGLLLGPTGCGKSRLLARLARVDACGAWADGASIVSQVRATPGGAIDALGSVGLNSIPVWLRPYASLSNGERQRARLARTGVPPIASIWEIKRV